MNVDRMNAAILEQKTAITSAIEAADDGDSLNAALALLRLVACVWAAAGTPYAGECASLCRTKSRNMLAAEKEYLASIRKNDKTRSSTEANVAKLEAILETLS